MDENFQKWRSEGKHLPDFLKDFHDQKEFFKFLHEFTTIEDHDVVKDINWVEGHCYTIDILLHVLSRFGYTIQHSRSHQNFDDLEKMMNLYKENRNAKFTAILNNSSEKK